MGKKHILKNLHSLIRNSALVYINEFVWQDIELTEEFKDVYSKHLKSNGYDIEFLGATAVITSSSTKYIYVPNQWFVIASYAVEVYIELQNYKYFFKKVAERLGKQLDSYTKHLRDKATIIDKNTFIGCSKKMFLTVCDDQEEIEEASQRLWRFVNDYSWWSGQKTIDRSDFFVSVILNMLNLVNVSQGYVADIVSVYANDPVLRRLVRNVDGFTINMEKVNSSESNEYSYPDEEIGNQTRVRENDSNEELIPKPERVRIKISGSKTLKEIRFKG